MKNPFRSEAAAFQLVCLSIVYFALIVAAVVDLDVARAIAVFVVLTAVAV